MSFRDQQQVHGTKPQYLIESILRKNIRDSIFWKEFCFGLNAASLIDIAVQISAIGGTYGNQKPTQFLCLLLKLLQLEPEEEIILFFIQQEDYKYLRALAAFYLRLTFKPTDIYKYLEPLLYDCNKLRFKTNTGHVLTYMDEFVDHLLRDDRYCDTILPRIPKRYVLEDLGELEPRVSKLEEELEDEDLMNDILENGNASEVEEEFNSLENEERNKKKTKEDEDDFKTKISKKKVNKLFKKDKFERMEEMNKKEREEDQLKLKKINKINSSGGDGDDSLSIEETNKIRLSLGLKPLKK